MTPDDAPRLHVTGRTRVTFIMGDPIGHVIGTAVLNAAWAAQGRDLVTVPLHVRSADLPRMLDMLRRAPNVAGSGITIPHKVAAAALVDRLTDAAAATGAVNFIRRDADGGLTGHNVDGSGFVAGLAAHGVDPAGRSVAVQGAGGVGRAIAFALAGAGVRSLTIRNRDAAKAAALAEAVRALTGCAVSAGGDAPAEILVNATSLGMRDGDPLPFGPEALDAAEAVAEVVMTPVVTPLLAAARARGLTAVPGRAMLDPQAALVAAFLDGDPA